MYNSLIRHSGNKELFQAVALSAAALTGGHPFHLHAEGLRGTGKTTILRAAGQMLPPIVRVRGCVYNCSPERPHCPEHRGLGAAEIERIGLETVPRPFWEISHSAKVGTVLGSIDLTRLVDRSEPAAALLPGTILQAHRGVVFIDEINRLADTSPELADVLLDVMGTKPGRVQVEETGLPVVDMPVEVTVWAASNPDEEPGGLAQVRKQLADRFDMVVTMGRPSEYRSVVEILAHRDGETAGGVETCFRSGDFRGVLVGEELRSVLAALYIDFGLESLRAVEGLETAARLTALLAGRRQVLAEDLFLAAPLVLSHRTDNVTLAGILKQLQATGGQQETRRGPDADRGQPRARGPSEAAEANPAAARWRQWWADLRQRLSTGRSRPGPSSNDNGKGSSGEERQAGATAGTSGVADPAHIEIAAPP
ncbi:MAG TPA: magnesium chelatase, partial [Negativicutes bacterium]|nr:magnesium chelatase [Negativicutes bacterium]